MPDLAHPRRTRALAILAGVAALGLSMCTAPKRDADPPLVDPTGAQDPVCSGAACPAGPSDGDAGPVGAARLPLGAPDCTEAAACSSEVCMLDVAGTPRCCEADCRISGRVCSDTGICVCASQYQDVGGLCLLANGQPCRTGDECANGHCTDNVCCDAACDNLCERCDDPRHVGTCAVYDQDPACVEQTNFACIARGRCRLPAAAAAFSCRSDLDCDSDHCEPALSGPAVCCATECGGVCERCTATGVCGFPATDPACPEVAPCPPDETCLAYRRPNPGECSGSGQCAAECEPLPARAGIPCGVGQQCDGNGECVVTALGRVAAGTRHTCAILDSGNVRCWGDNRTGQLGTAFEQTRVGDDEDPASSGLELDFGRTAIQITAGFAHTCVLFREGGKVRCWGRVFEDLVFGTVQGLLGTDVVGVHASGWVDPLGTGDVRLPEQEVAIQVSAANGGAHTCAVTDSGKVYCWGLNNEGQCGIGQGPLDVGGTNEELQPVVLDPNDPNARALQVAAGDMHTCALLSGGGRVTCWGAGYNGQLGYGDDITRTAPLGSVPIGEPVTQIAAGFGHTCAVLERGRVRCWGGNTKGQLGYGHALSIGDDETPEQALTIPRAPGSSAFLGGDALIGGGNVVQITSVVDAFAVCARFSSGIVRCWGENGKGELGYGHTLEDGHRFSPDELHLRPAYTDAAGGIRYMGGDVALGGAAVALADGGRCALVRPDGAASSAALALYCWGDHLEAQLGLPRLFSADPSQAISSSNSTPVELGPVNWE